MRPIHYKEIPLGVKFIYKLSEFKEWYRRGKEHGDVGPLLTHYIERVNVYLAFGTIENPNTSWNRIYMVHNDIFDGPRPTPEKIINPDPVERPLHSYKFVFLDNTEYNLPNYDSSDKRKD